MTQFSNQPSSHSAFISLLPSIRVEAKSSDLGSEVLTRVTGPNLQMDP